MARPRRARLFRGSSSLPVPISPPLFPLLLLVRSYGTADATSPPPPTLSEPFQTSFERLPHAPCVSLYHRTGRVGCGTLGRSTATGRLVHWSSVISSSSSGDDGGGDLPAVKMPPYVAAMGELEYTSDNVDALVAFGGYVDDLGAPTDDGEGAGSLRGILVLNSTSTSSHSDGGDGDGDGGGGYGDANVYYSPAPQTPRGYGTPSSYLSIDGDYGWNANGDGMTVRDMYGVPAVYIPSSDVSSYLYTASKAQGDAVTSLREEGRTPSEEDLYPSVAAEFNYYMGPEGIASEECLGWRDAEGGKWSPKCLPVGGNSVWAVAGSPEGGSGSDYGDGDYGDGGGDGDGDGGGGGRRAEDGGDGGGGDRRPVIVLATNLDSTSMFHDSSPGSNSAASNVLTLLMASKLLGTVHDATLDRLPRRIAVAFFQAEMFGYVGSRLFLGDASGFACDEGGTVPAVARNADSSSKMGCLNPLRPSLEFTNLGDIVGMVAVDQVGVLSTEGTLYVHGGEGGADGGGGDDGGDDGGGDGDGDGGGGGGGGGGRALGDRDDYGDVGAFLSEVLLKLGTDGYTIAESSTDYLPPTPLTSLIKISGGAAGGAVLSGYDGSFADDSRYQSHLDSNRTRPVDLGAVAAAATALARAALAAAYDGGDGDSDGAAEFASDIIDAAEEDDEDMAELAHCLLADGNCGALLRYGKVEAENARRETGVNLGVGQPLGNPPSYYPGVYDHNNGQGWVQVGDKWYGAYTGVDGVEYGASKGDAFLLRPSLLEMAVRGLLDNFLGWNAASFGEEEEVTLAPCKSTGDCSKVEYCEGPGEAVCTGGGACVCARSHYHPALDGSLYAAPNNFTGRFLVRGGGDGQDDGGDDGGGGVLTAMYTEPYWSYAVGVRVYRDAGGRSGNWALGAGAVVAAACVGSTVLARRRLRKEKLY